MSVSSLWAQRGGFRIGKGTFGRVEVGGSFLNLDGLNQALEEDGYEKLNPTYFSLGFGLDRFKRRWVIGGSLYNFMIQESFQNNQTARLSYHYLTVRGGMVLFYEPEKFLIYPSVGIGAGLANVRERPASEPLPFEYWTQGVLIDARLTASMVSELDVAQKVEWSISIGYLHDPLDTWQLTSFRPDNPGIPINPGGFYFRLGMGMGNWRR